MPEHLFTIFCFDCWHSFLPGTGEARVIACLWIRTAPARRLLEGRAVHAPAPPLPNWSPQKPRRTQTSIAVEDCTEEKREDPFVRARSASIASLYHFSFSFDFFFFVGVHLQIEISWGDL